MSTGPEEASTDLEMVSVQRGEPWSLVLRLAVSWLSGLALDSVHLNCRARQPGEVEASLGRELLDVAGEVEQKWEGRSGCAGRVL